MISYHYRLKALPYLSQVILLASVALCAVSAQAKNKVGDVIPKAFQGTWTAAQTTSCTKNDPTRLRITPHQLTYWESTAKVQRVYYQGDAMTVKVSQSGEGETREVSLGFKLRNNNSELVAMLEAGHQFVRYRCR